MVKDWLLGGENRLIKNKGKLKKKNKEWVEWMIKVGIFI